MTRTKILDTINRIHDEEQAHGAPALCGVRPWGIAFLVARSCAEMDTDEWTAQNLFKRAFDAACEPMTVQGA